MVISKAPGDTHSGANVGWRFSEIGPPVTIISAPRTAASALWAEGRQARATTPVVLEWVKNSSGALPAPLPQQLQPVPTDWERELPLLVPGDYVMVHDVGGYYHASHSRYNLRQSPPVYGYSESSGGAGGDADEPTFELLQSGETVEETTMFFDVRDSGVGGEQLL